jgi:hypothetical protein
MCLSMAFAEFFGIIFRRYDEAANKGSLSIPEN